MDNKELKFFPLRAAMIFLYIIVVAIIPVAIRMKVVDFSSPVETWYRLSSTIVADVFAQFRFELLLIVTTLIIIIALLKYYYDSDRGNFYSYVDYPTAGFAVLVVLSGLLSPFTSIAFWGFYNRAEGVLAYLSYLIIFIVAANFINNSHDKKLIFYGAIAAGIIQSVIAITQFFGFDILQSDLAISLIVPGEYMAYVGEIEYMFASKAYGTTFNPNYLGGYMAMIFPISFVKYLFTKTPRETIIWLFIFVVCLAGLLVSVSAGAFIASGLALCIVFLFTLKHFNMYYKKLVLALAIILIIAAVTVLMSGDMITKISPRLSDKLFTTSGNLIHEEEPAFEAEKFLPGEKININLPSPRPFDSFATKRGYIWRKSLEMMKGNFIIGDGLDTFIYNFPHWDYERDHRFFRMGLLIDKPHNTYMQIALGVGGIGLLVYLYILVLHFKNYLSLIRIKGINNEQDILMLAVFAGWLGYLFQGLSNDSVISNAPVFWALFGLSVNYVKNSLVIEQPEPSRRSKKKKK